MFISLWALEGWEIISFEWLREFLGMATEYRDELYFIEWIDWPLDYVERVLFAVSQSENFHPSNWGFIVFYTITVYPALWLFMN